MYTRCGAFEDFHDKDCEDCLRDDEALWTEYAKAVFMGVYGKLYSEGSKDGILGTVIYITDAMLTAHKKRWGHE